MVAPLTSKLVSVVIAVFNGRDDIGVTLNSILNENDVDLEVVLVDDGSDTETSTEIDRIARSDSRISVIRQENAGLTRALIAGCSVARGEFIARVDNGDRVLRGRFRRQRELLETDESLAFVSCWTRVAEVSGHELYISKGTGAALAAVDLIDLDCPSGVIDGPTHHGAVMFRRRAYECVGGYRPEFYYGQDWDLWYRMAQHGRFRMLPEVLYEARISVNDISMNQRARQQKIGRCSLEALKLRMAGVSDEPALAEAGKIRPLRGRSFNFGGVFRGCYFLGESLRRNGRRDVALSYFRRAVRENPFHLQSWIRLLQVYIK